MSNKTFEVTFYIVLVAILAVLIFFIFKPYLTALFIAVVLAITFNNSYHKLVLWFKGRRNLSAIAMVMFIMLIILLPLSILGVLLFQEVRDVSLSLSEYGGAFTYLDTKLTVISNYINVIAPDMGLSLNSNVFLSEMMEWVAGNFSIVFSGVASIVLKTFLMIIALFFFLRDGHKLKHAVVMLSPLKDKHDIGVLNKLGVAINSVIKGSILIAMLQGFLAGLGFLFFGISSPVMWGFIAAIMAFIPSVGTGVVVFPFVFMLYFTGNPIASLGLLLWGVFIVGLVDNILRPILIEKGVKIHPFLILLSVFGGIGLFGPIGFLLGPIVLAFMLALIDMYPQIMGHNHSDNVKSLNI